MVRAPQGAAVDTGGLGAGAGRGPGFGSGVRCGRMPGLGTRRRRGPGPGLSLRARRGRGPEPGLGTKAWTRTWTWRGPGLGLGEDLDSRDEGLDSHGEDQSRWEAGDAGELEAGLRCVFWWRKFFNQKKETN